MSHASNKNKEPESQSYHTSRTQPSSARRLHPTNVGSSVTDGCVPSFGLSMHRGYIKLWRKIEDSAIYRDTNAFRVFLDLLIRAQWRPGRGVVFKGKEIKLEPGQLTIGRIELGARLGIPPSTVRRSLLRLQNIYRIIEMKTNSKWTLVTLLNWDTYQVQDNEKEHLADIPPDIPPDTLKEGKKERKKESIYIDHDSFFEELWKEYPKRVGKKHAKRHFRATVKTEKDEQNIKQALNNYKKCKSVSDGYVKNGSTWFNEWEDWINYNEERTESDEERNRRLLAEIRNG